MSGIVHRVDVLFKVITTGKEGLRLQHGLEET
jgi:hypothetical protein